MKSFNLALGGLATLVALSPLAHSQTEAPATTLPKVRVQGDSEALYKAETAAATKTDTLLRDTPQSISVVTREVMNDQNVQNIADVVRYVPGITMAQGEGNRETPVLRGSSSTGDFFLDGMRDDVQYYRDLYNIERVEILKGPNGMLFGRGGIGGLINRVTKEATRDPVREASLQGGSHNNRRVTADLSDAIGENAAVRINGVLEDSESYRDDVTLERYGFSPTATFWAGENTKIVVGGEYFKDERIADRGVSAFNGKPVRTDPSMFFGDPAQSPVEAEVKSGHLYIEHVLSEAITLSNRTRYADYDKFYQNVFPGAVTDAGANVTINAYNNDTQRENLFNQTDVTLTLDGGGMRHTVLTGVELGSQDTQNFRNTGYFGTATSISVPLNNPRTTFPVEFRQSATDADNDSAAKIAAVYVQDQIELNPQWQVLVGARYDKFEVDFTNNRDGNELETSDDLISPRAGIIYKPAEPVSIYASYSKTFQPRAGDQLSSLTVTNTTLDPEEFTNYEVGLKWDALQNLSLGAALYELERSNVAVATSSTTSALVDGQRVRGLELQVAGELSEAWSLIGGYAYQDGEITSNQSATILEGAKLASLPEHSFSLWNRYDVTPRVGVALGVVYRDEIFAQTQNLAATTPEGNTLLDDYFRVDAAVYLTISDRVRAQVNVENLLDEEYFVSAHSNTNITPGSPLAARALVQVSF